MTSLECKTMLQPFCGPDNDTGRWVLCKPWLTGTHCVATDTKILAWLLCDEPAETPEPGRGKLPPVEPFIESFNSMNASTSAWKPLPFVISQSRWNPEGTRIIDGNKYRAVRDITNSDVIAGFHLVHYEDEFAHEFDLKIEGVRFGLSYLGIIAELQEHGEPQYVAGHHQEKPCLWFTAGPIKGLLMAMTESKRSHDAPA